MITISLVLTCTKSVRNNRCCSSFVFPDHSTFVLLKTNIYILITILLYEAFSLHCFWLSPNSDYFHSVHLRWTMIENVQNMIIEEQINIIELKPMVARNALYRNSPLVLWIRDDFDAIKKPEKGWAIFVNVLDFIHVLRNIGRQWTLPLLHRIRLSDRVVHNLSSPH